MTSLLRNTVLTLVTGTLATLSLPSFAALSKYALIDGASQEIVLEENTGLTLEGSADRHYAGSLKDFPDSWVSASVIDGQWEGMVSHNGRLYLISALADSPLTSSASSRFAAATIDSDMGLGSCGIERTPILRSSSASSAQALTAEALVSKAISVNFPTYCSETVNGVCLLAELTMVFDTQFIQAFPSNYSSRANAILNSLDTFYKEELEIVFQRLNVDIGSNRFTTSTDPGDILDDMYDDRFENRTTAFDPNKRAIMHLVTGRDFVYGDDDNVVGLANSPGYDVALYPNGFDPILCDTGGATVGTSQVVQANSQMTALVVIHEIGHNFGADHDGEAGGVATSCTDPTKVMYPSLSGSMDSFSTCSKDTIATNISKLTSVESCFNFPIDASISAQGGNTTQVSTPDAAFIQNYNVNLATANGRNGSISVTGNITSGDATFTTVTLAGNGCALSNNSQTYTCTSANLAASSTLAASMSSGDGNLTISHSISAASSSNLYDTDSTDNSISETIRLLAPGLPPGQLAGTFSREEGKILLSWQDHSTNEQNFVLERRVGSGEWTVFTSALTPNTQAYADSMINSDSTYSYRISAVFAGVQSAPSAEITVSTSDVLQGSTRFGSGGGGGGSLPLWLLSALAGMFLLRQRRH